MIIPIDALEADTLYSLAESFVLREGTDYGAEEVALDVKVQQVLNRLKFTTLRLGSIFGSSIGMRFHTAVNKFCWQALERSSVHSL